MRKELLARRMDRIESSGIRKVFNLAAELKNPINLSIGQPDFDVPAKVKEAAKQAIDAGFNRYTLTKGIPELREAVTERYRRRGVRAEDCIITSGTSGGILLSYACLLDEGDEILISDPYFVMYKHLANFIGARPVFVDTYPDFHMTRERIEPLITSRTKALMLNCPTNPTGAVLSRAEIEAIADLARAHDLLVISDEVYDLFQYDAPPVSIAEYYPKTLVLNGFSKIAAMTGWRVGYALGPADLIAAMEEVQQYSFVCAPSFAQKAALAALDLDMAGQVAAYRRKRDRIFAGLNDRFDLRPSEGSFYTFPGTRNGDGDGFVSAAVESGILVIPGSVFSERKTHFRISFAASDETIERGIEGLCRLADRFWA